MGTAAKTGGQNNYQANSRAAAVARAEYAGGAGAAMSYRGNTARDP